VRAAVVVVTVPVAPAAVVVAAVVVVTVPVAPG
jgi:hypothetical protein